MNYVVLRGGGTGNPGSVPWRCNSYPEAMDNCLETCQVCGCRDTTESFVVILEEGPASRSCAWGKYM